MIYKPKAPVAEASQLEESKEVKAEPQPEASVEEKPKRERKRKETKN